MPEKTLRRHAKFHPNQTTHLSYVISIFKMASMESPVSGLMTSEDLNLFANAYFNEISNLCPRYYYFRFLTKSSATAEIARAGGHYAVQCRSR